MQRHPQRHRVFGIMAQPYIMRAAFVKRVVAGGQPAQLRQVGRQVLGQVPPSTMLQSSVIRMVANPTERCCR